MKGKLMPQRLPQGVNSDYVKLVDGVYYDLCVSCKADTGVRTDHSIELRMYYVEGFGQLCEKCWHDTDSSA